MDKEKEHQSSRKIMIPPPPSLVTPEHRTTKKGVYKNNLRLKPKYGGREETWFGGGLGV